MPSGAAPKGLDADEVLNILSRPDDAGPAELVELVARICDSEAAGIAIQRGDTCHVPVTHGIEPLTCPAESSFCQHTVGMDGIFCVEDAQADPRFCGIGFGDGRLATTRFYASAPLYAPDGAMVGRLCVIDSQPKILTPLQRRSLETLALSVTKLIELRLLRARSGPAAPNGEQSAATIISQLAAELSHDMRIPLTSIIASVELLEDELGDHTDGTVSALLDSTSRAADRMARMLEQNMDLGRQSDAPVSTAVDLTRVVYQLTLDSGPYLEQHGATVEVGELPVLHANPDNMYSVLQNLVTNSVKYARPDVPAMVRISACRGAAGWRIAVRDNGVGIPEHRRVDVFSLFSRVDQDVAGHGIGLATVARIITAHGGSVGAEEAPDGGAEVWFELPDSAAPEKTAC